MVGIDEVGRGCLAGPLLVVASRANRQLPSGLRDSKVLTKEQRVKILNTLSICCDFGEGWVSASEIDRLGLAGAMRLGVSRALRGLKAKVDDDIIMDGSVNYVPRKFKNTKCVIGGDDLVPIISAASIYAKVTRDKFMTKLAQKHPNYNFEKHVGYGTAAHLLALQKYGVIKFVHRTSFAPVKALA